MWNSLALDDGAAAERAAVKRHVAGGHGAMVSDEPQDVSLDAQDHGIEGFAQPGRAVRDRA